MKSITPSLEVISPSYGSSFTYAKYGPNTNDDVHLWHYHPEIELVFLNGGAGKRQIGNHISYFTNGSLLLLGSNLPHCGFTNKNTGNKSEIVIHIKPDFLGKHFFDSPEMKKIQILLEQSKSGIAFVGETKTKIGNLLEQMNSQEPFERMLSLLNVLETLAISEAHKRFLNADGFQLEMQVQDNDRINIVLKYIKEHFKEHITIDEVSNIANMTTSSFCRYFKKITNKTFTEFLNEYRLVYASKLLAEKPISINEVCYESGFNNFSHFSKSFKEYTGKSASQYRQEFNTMII